uniref:Ig-like domain-containing protein n=1 Tax=Denticeps clupeoides TaxID=299321 RepID=A0AAY4AHK9_9TELE
FSENLLCCSIRLMCRGKDDTVTQLEFQKIHSEGEMVKLSCGYKTTSSGPDLLWYRQKSNDFPRFLLLRNEYSAGQNGTDLTERFHSKVDSDSKSRVHLKLFSASVRDSALHYCALKPTVTGNSGTLDKNQRNTIRIFKSPVGFGT